MITQIRSKRGWLGQAHQTIKITNKNLKQKGKKSNKKNR